jgi:hypothetical protein
MCGPDEEDKNKAHHRAAESSGVPALFAYLTADISTPQMSYFKHWDKLLDMENKASEQALHHHSNQHGVWTNPKGRDKVFSVCSTATATATTTARDLISKTTPDISKKSSLPNLDLHKHVWTLCQSSDAEVESCFDMDFVVGDRISLSLEKNLFHQQGSSSTRTQTTSVTCEDVEETASAAAAWDVMNVEPHVASGVVLEINENTISVGFAKLSSRLQR